MVGPQQQLSGSLIIIELTKFIGFFFGNFFISKNVSLKKSLHISHETLNNIKCPSDKMSSLEYWS